MGKKKKRLVSDPRPQWEYAGWRWLALPFPESNQHVSKRAELVGPLGALGLVGRSDDLRGKIEDVEKVIRGAKTIKVFNDPGWEKSVDALETLLGQYQHFLDRVLAAEDVLRENGLRLDREGKIKFVSSKREYLNWFIVGIYSEYVGNDGPPENERIMRAMRREIKKVIANFLPGVELDDGPRGNIARAIENYRSP